MAPVRYVSAIRNRTLDAKARARAAFLRPSQRGQRDGRASRSGAYVRARTTSFGVDGWRGAGGAERSGPHRILLACFGTAAEPQPRVRVLPGGRVLALVVVDLSCNVDERVDDRDGLSLSRPKALDFFVERPNLLAEVRYLRAGRAVRG